MLWRIHWYLFNCWDGKSCNEYILGPKRAYLVNLINLNLVDEYYKHGNPYAVDIVTALTTELIRTRRWWWWQRRWRQRSTLSEINVVNSDPTKQYSFEMGEQRQLIKQEDEHQQQLQSSFSGSIPLSSPSLQNRIVLMLFYWINSAPVHHISVHTVPDAIPSIYCLKNISIIAFISAQT